MLCLHADLSPGPYNPITKEEIAGSGLTYLALGHIHQASGLLRQGNTFYAYPGCPEGRGFDELGEKGVLLVEAEGGKVNAEFVPLCRRRYEIVTVDVTDADPRQQLEAAVAPFSAADILRVVFTGEIGEDGVDLPALETPLPTGSTAWTCGTDPGGGGHLETGGGGLPPGPVSPGAAAAV